jgi:regulator of replication initiation timing
LSHGSSSINKSRRSLINQIDNLQQVNKTKRKIGENNFDLTEEWYETLKFCNMTQEEYIKYCSNKQFTQLTDVIEYLYKLILDKNIQIRLLTEENDSLNLENLNISKRLLELSETIEKMMNNKHDVKARNHKFQTNNSTFVNVDGSAINVLDNDGVNMNIALDYLKEVKQSITSSEFQEGMILDQFDLVSEMSKDQKHFPQHDQDDTKEQSNGGENGINNNSRQDKIEIHLNQPMYSSYKKS